MVQERRKSKRRPLVYGASVVSFDGTLKRDCVIDDISATGAKLRIEAPKELPEEFVLLLSARGDARRHCKIAWRGPQEIGVRFRAG
jgi:PilZ domain-containing protein